MAYRFRRKETAATGFRRIAREQTAASVSLLADRGNDVGNRVHDARRHIKRLRALLQLVRDAIVPATFQSEHKALRAAGRRLSKTRDADVSLATFEALTRHFPKAQHQEIRELFEEKARRARRTISRAQLGALAVAVRKSGLKIAAASLAADGWNLLHGGLAQSLRRARKVRSGLERNPADAVLHEWRKLVKRLFHQMELLKPGLATQQRKMLQKLERLSATLGKHHDLHVLEQCLRDYRARKIAVKQTEELACLSEKRRKQLARRIRKLSAAIFRQKHKAVLRQIHRAWKAGRKTC